MHKQPPKLEWRFSESDAEWAEQQALLLPEVTAAISRRLRLKQYVRFVMTTLIFFTSVGGWWRYSTQAKLQADEAELRMAVQQKPVLVVTSDGEALAATIKGEWSDADWRPEYGWADPLRQNGGLPIPVQRGDAGSGEHTWEKYGWEYSGLPAPVQPDDPIVPLEVVVQRMELIGDQAIANVILHEQNGKPVYRQTRFYRRISNGGWQPAPPDAALWGAVRTLATPYFVYHFRQRDAAVVAAVAPQIDALYTRMWGNFGLPILSMPEKLVITVSVTETPGHITSWYIMRNQLVVPSPAVYTAPVGLTDSEVLAQSIALLLVGQVMAQASEYHTLRWSQQPVLSGLHLWQVWELDLPLAGWREAVVEWLYLDWPGSNLGQTATALGQHTALCAAHRLWMLAPTWIGIPLLCTGGDGDEEFLGTWGPRDPLLRLDEIILTLPAAGYADQTRSSYLADHRQIIALATLIEYAVATYGRDRLPVLVARLGQHQSWNTLLPAVYGVSAAEFEAGWQAYLTAHYGVAEERP